uniref:Uncharacterized protein n=1 Tax=Falco tinnunculus TaxID=100819 RepID=A0A8C4TPG2_FALTI
MEDYVPKDFIQLKSEKLSVDEVSELVISPYSGAVSLFIGTTRNNFEEKKVVHLRKWPSVKHTAVHHRFAYVVVQITEASVIIVIPSPHRAEYLEARTPLFPILSLYFQEIYEDEYSWKENKECFWAKSTEKKI